MKKSEQAMILFIAVISIMVAYAIGNAVFGKATAHGTTVKMAQTITSSVDTPDNTSTVFNKNNINPTVQIELTGSSTPAAPGASTPNSDSGQ